MKTRKAPPRPRQAPCATFSQLGEFRVLTLREIPKFGTAETPPRIAEYYRKNVVVDPRFNADVETLVCITLNVRHEILGHYVVANGTLDTLLCHPREVFRAAIVANATAVVMLHSHPSGDPAPSEADIKTTHELIGAAEILKIALLDHIVMGRATPERPKDYYSLREAGYFDPEPAPTPPQIKGHRRKKATRSHGKLHVRIGQYAALLGVKSERLLRLIRRQERDAGLSVRLNALRRLERQPIPLKLLRGEDERNPRRSSAKMEAAR